MTKIKKIAPRDRGDFFAFTHKIGAYEGKNSVYLLLKNVLHWGII